MTLAAWLAFVLTTALLVAVPGPNVSLIVATTLAHGLRAGLLVVVGVIAGASVHVVVVVAGLVVLVEAATGVLRWLQVAGALYLVWLGLKMWRAPAAGAPTLPAGRAVTDGALVALANPTTPILLAAFFVQFVDGTDATTNLLVLAITFLVVIAVGDALWAVVAARFRDVLDETRTLLARRIGAAILMLGGAALAVAGV